LGWIFFNTHFTAHQKRFCRIGRLLAEAFNGFSRIDRLRCVDPNKSDSFDDTGEFDFYGIAINDLFDRVELAL